MDFIWKLVTTFCNLYVMIMIGSAVLFYNGISTPFHFTPSPIVGAFIIVWLVVNFICWEVIKWEK